MSQEISYKGYYQDKAGIVTGAASGIGAELARQLLDAGAEICIADWNQENLDKAKVRFASFGSRVSFVQVDVANQDQVQMLVQNFAKEKGKLDLLFNNAGILQTGPIEKITRAAWERIVNINLWGVLNGCYAAMPIMINQGHGHIINTASLGGIFSPGFQVSYGTTKAAVIAFSEGMRYELQLKGIRVTTVCPGDVQSNLYGNSLAVTDPESWQKCLEQAATDAASAPPVEQVEVPDFYEEHGVRFASAPFACREILTGVALGEPFVITPHDYIVETFLLKKYFPYFLQTDDFLAASTKARSDNYEKTGNIYLSEK